MKEIFYTVKATQKEITTQFWEIDPADMRYCKKFLDDIEDFYNLTPSARPFLDRNQKSIRHNKTEADITGAGVNSIMTVIKGLKRNFSKPKKTDFTFAEAENLEDVSDIMNTAYGIDKIRFVRKTLSNSSNYTFLDLFDV